MESVVKSSKFIFELLTLSNQMLLKKYFAPLCTARKEIQKLESAKLKKNIANLAKFGY